MCVLGTMTRVDIKQDLAIRSFNQTLAHGPKCQAPAITQLNAKCWPNFKVLPTYSAQIHKLKNVMAEGEVTQHSER